jgi:hypothetical protein
MTAMTKLTRTLVLVTGLTGTVILTASPAGATPGRRSCKDLGALIASEAHAGTIGDENRSLPHGSLDDLIHAVQVGGEFFGETIPAFCRTR